MIDIYQAIFLLKIDVHWAENQNVWFLLALIDQLIPDNETNKKQIATNSDLLSAMV